MANFYYAVCPFGLETLLADELQRVGAERLEPGKGGVGFTGGHETAMAACLHSRLASRVLMRVAEAEYWDSRDIYDLARRTDRKSTRLNSSHVSESRMPSSA